MFCELTLIGNLGRDPEMRFTPSGQPVTSFSVACNRSYQTADGQRRDETTWVRVTVWGKLAEVCAQYLKKGRQIFARGRLVIDPVTGGPKVYSRQDGTSGASFEMTAETIKFLGSRGEVEAEHHAEGGAPEADDIPF
jgi:single-strand DNA-binding protein